MSKQEANRRLHVRRRARAEVARQQKIIDGAFGFESVVGSPDARLVVLSRAQMNGLRSVIKRLGLVN